MRFRFDERETAFRQHRASANQFRQQLRRIGSAPARRPLARARANAFDPQLSRQRAGRCCRKRSWKISRAIAWKSFFLPLVGFGTFPGKGRPKSSGSASAPGHPHLFQLHKRVQEAALAAGLEPDLRSFHPHVTLARCRDVSPETIRPFLKAHAGFDAGMIHVESFCLNSSELTPAGSVYTRGARRSPE